MRRKEFFVPHTNDLPSKICPHESSCSAYFLLSDLKSWDDTRVWLCSFPWVRSDLISRKANDHNNFDTSPRPREHLHRNCSVCKTWVLHSYSLHHPEQNIHVVDDFRLYLCSSVVFFVIWREWHKHCVRARSASLVFCNIRRRYERVIQTRYS